MNKIGLIAGNGRFPILFAQAARRRGLRVIAVAMRGETLPEIEQQVDKLYWATFVQPGKWIKAFKKEGVDKAVMAGGVTKSKMYSRFRWLRFRPDLRAIKLWYRSTKDKRDYSLLQGVADELAAEGIELLNSIEYMGEHLAREGVCTKRKPTAREMEDIEFGWDIAKQLAHTQVGQCIAVKEKTVIAVEAVEGTDSMLKRAGELARGGFVVIKVSKPGQDLRFDVPTIGTKTIENMKQAGATALAVEADLTLMLDKQDVIAAADRAGIAIIACRKS